MLPYHLPILPLTSSHILYPFPILSTFSSLQFYCSVLASHFPPPSLSHLLFSPLSLPSPHSSYFLPTLPTFSPLFQPSPHSSYLLPTVHLTGDIREDEVQSSSVSGRVVLKLHYPMLGPWCGGLCFFPRPGSLQGETGVTTDTFKGREHSLATEWSLLFSQKLQLPAETGKVWPLRFWGRTSTTNVWHTG